MTFEEWFGKSDIPAGFEKIARGGWNAATAAAEAEVKGLAKHYYALLVENDKRQKHQCAIRVARKVLVTLEDVKENIPCDPIYFWLHRINDAKAELEALLRPQESRNENV